MYAALTSGILPVTAQEALRTAVQGDRAFEARNATKVQTHDERLRAGPVNFQISAGYQLQWNDNIHITATNAANDLLQMPQVNLRAMWPATRDSTFTIGAGIGYQTYLENHELDRLQITPDSEVAWDIPVEDFVFTLHDRVEYSQEVISQGGLSGVAQFPRLENTVGARVQWHPGEYLFEVGYDHYLLSADAASFDYLSRNSEQFFGRAARRFAAITRAGVEVSGSLTDYDTPIQSDNQSVSFGPFADWQLQQDLRLTLRGGSVMYFSDRSLVSDGSSGLNSYYFGADVNHHLTDFITHGVAANREVQQGVNPGSDYNEQLRVRYFVAWAFHRSADLAADFFYEHAREPQPDLLEEYDRFGGSLGLTCRPTEHFSAGVSYRFTKKDSNLEHRNYRQNVVTLNLAYRF